MHQEALRKAEQGSVQTQGEGGEIYIEDLLRQAFPEDDIEEVGKGQKGADVDALLDDPFGLGSDSDSNEEDSGNADNVDDKENFKEVLHLPQVFYCSRTHSQIAQFVSEIRKTVFGANARVITLGSRKNMCINSTVTKLASDLQIQTGHPSIPSSN